MTRRMLDSAIWHNEKFGTMPAMARLLAIGVINHADDQGRGKANPVYLRSQIFPYDDVTASDVAQWLRMVADNETITIYQADGKEYYQVLNWWQYQAHQYAMPSQYPKPDGWSDRIRKSLTKGVIITCNWITNDGKRSPDTCDEQGRPVQVNNQVNDQVNIQGEDTNLSLNLSSSISLSSSLSSSSSSKTNGAAADALIDPDLAKAIAVWKEEFAGTPHEGTPPVALLPKWLAFSGPDVLCYMIGKAKDKGNPGGWLYTTYDNWRQDGEVAPFVVRAVQQQKQAGARQPVTHIINPITGQPEALQ